MVNLRIPSLDAPTPQGQIKLLHSYLYQLVGELQAELTALENELTACRQDNQALREALRQVTEK